jgi:hypothetical protein
MESTEMLVGKIARYRGNGREAAIDSTTALWAGRMLYGEAGQNCTEEQGAAVLWCTMYRYLGMPHKWDSYLSMIRLFSQPINDRWLPGGDLFEKYKNSKNEVYQNATSDRAVARRRKIQSMEWSALPQTIQLTVGIFALGQLPPPSGFNGMMMSNFASYDGVDKKYPGGTWIGGNYYFVDPQLDRNFQVEVIPNVGTPLPTDIKKKTEDSETSLL